MYQSIETRYYGPGNVRGSRVKARAAAGSLTLPWDHSLNPEQNHLAAAKALATKLQWAGRYHGGCNHEGRYVFVIEAGGQDSGFVIQTDDNRRADVA